jgi:hypothetical protein
MFSTLGGIAVQCRKRASTTMLVRHSYAFVGTHNSANIQHHPHPNLEDWMPCYADLPYVPRGSMLKWGDSDNGKQDEQSSEAIQWSITIIEEWTRLVYPPFALYNLVESFGGLHQECITPISPPFSTSSQVAKHACHGSRRPVTFPPLASRIRFLGSIPSRFNRYARQPSAAGSRCDWWSRP